MTVQARTTRLGRQLSHLVLAIGVPLSALLAVLDDLAGFQGRIALAVLGLLALAAGVWLHDHPARRPWLLVLAGLAASLVADLVVLAAASVGPAGGDLVADNVLTLLSGLLVLAGTVDATRAVRGSDLGGSLDALMVATATAIVLWQVVVAPAAAPGWSGTATAYLGALQILAVTWVGSLLLRTAVLLPRDRRVAGLLLSGAVASALVSYLLGAVRDSTEVLAHYGGLRASTGALTAVLVGAALLHPSVVALTTEMALPPDRLTIGRLVGIGGALIAPVVVVVQASTQGLPIASTSLLVGWGVLVPTVLARVVMLTRERAAAESQVLAGEQRLAALLANTSDVLLQVVADPDGTARISYASPAARSRLGRDPATLIGCELAELVGEEHRARLQDLLRHGDEGLRREDLPIAAASGAPRWFEVVIDRGPQLADGTASTVVALRDISDRKRAELAWVEAALRDPLTALPNRRGIDQHVERAAVRSAPDQLTIGVLLADLDGFKQVNDTAGHAVGDAVLVTVAKRLAGAVREGDLVGRLGGDEFVVVCLGTTDPTVLTEVAERLLQVVPAPIEVDGVVHQVGLSVGVAVGTADGSSLHALVREADAALYRAKRAGRGRIEWAGAPAGR